LKTDLERRQFCPGPGGIQRGGALDLASRGEGLEQGVGLLGEQVHLAGGDCDA
jgi:hypothetical protein